MSDIVECKIFPVDDAAMLKNSGTQRGVNGSALLQIYRAGSETAETIILTSGRAFTLHFGDKIMCIKGMAFVMINPGSAAAGFFVCPQMPLFPDNFTGKYRVVLEITDELTKTIPRGHMMAGKDIGTVQTAAGTFTR